MRLGWLSDIHLNFFDDEDVRRHLAGLSSYGADAWAVSGDIAEAGSVVGCLRLFAELVPGTTYFALGNHDFYGGSFAKVRESVARLVEETPRLVWLSAAGPQALDGSVALVGDDVWADARFGDAAGSPVDLLDFHVIEDFAGLSRIELVRALNRLGDEAAARLEPKLERAAASSDRVIVVTHGAPFREATWHKGRQTDDDWLPWFSCRAVGEALMRCARAHPAVRFLVLCGHTHSPRVYSPAENVRVHAGEAEYRRFRVQSVFDVRSEPGGSFPR